MEPSIHHTPITHPQVRELVEQYVARKYPQTYENERQQKCQKVLPRVGKIIHELVRFCENSTPHNTICYADLAFARPNRPNKVHQYDSMIVKIMGELFGVKVTIPLGDPIGHCFMLRTYARGEGYQIAFANGALERLSLSRL